MLWGGAPPPISADCFAMRQQRNYNPVMKFVRYPAEGPDQYCVHRMTYSGDGGWSYPLDSGPLDKLLRTYIQHIGKDSFFELY